MSSRLGLSHTVIPGRERQRANPESRTIFSACIWIPGPAFGRPGMTKVEIAVLARRAPE
jgi:hypothetical protein